MGMTDAVLEAIGQMPRIEGQALVDSVFADVAGKQELEMADYLAGQVSGVSRRGALEFLGKLGMVIGRPVRTLERWNVETLERLNIRV